MMTVENIKPIKRQELFIRLYQTAFPKIAAYIYKNGGSLEESKDIFQDALVIYYEKSRGINFELRSDETAYLFGISKNLWYKKYNENKLTRSLTQLPEQIVDENSQQIVSERVLQFLERSGKKCVDLLQSFYYEKLNMKDVAKKFGFAGERSATAQKYKCLEKIRAVIQNHSLTKSDFYE